MTGEGRSLLVSHLNKSRAEGGSPTVQPLPVWPVGSLCWLSPQQTTCGNRRTGEAVAGADCATVAPWGPFPLSVSSSGYFPGYASGTVCCLGARLAASVFRGQDCGFPYPSLWGCWPSGFPAGTRLCVAVETLEPCTAARPFPGSCVGFLILGSRRRLRRAGGRTLHPLCAVIAKRLKHSAKRHRGGA